MSSGEEVITEHPSQTLDNASEDTSSSSPDFNKSERRRSTTVIMTNNVTKPDASEKEGGVRRTGSMRRRLSKQNATIEEPMYSTEQNIPDNVPSIAEHPEENKADEMRRGLHREDAVVGDDDTKLRPPPPNALNRHSWSASKSLSRESNGTDYSDRSGTDLRQFLLRTLHKSEEDRQQLFLFEKQMTELIEDETIQSKKIELPSSYHRMLLHRCAAWFGLDHNVTNKQTEVVINKSDRSKVPDDKLADLVMNDDFAEASFSPRNRQMPRRGLSHVESYPSADMSNQFGSQASLNNDLMMMRRAQSFDVSPQPQMIHVSPIPPIAHQAPRFFTNSSNSLNQNHAQPMRQLSLQCGPPQQPMIAAPMSGPGAAPHHHGHWGAPQRSFDCGRHYEPHDAQQRYYYSPRQTPVMRKAESFGGMANPMPTPAYVEAPQPVPVICHAPMVHHHPQGYQYNCYEEQYHQEAAMCSPSVAHYECGPIPPQQPQMCVRPVKYTYIQHQPEFEYHQAYEPMPQYRPPVQHTHVYYQPAPAPAPQQYIQPSGQYYYPNGQYVGVQPEVIVDPVQAQPFPVVGHFTTPTSDQQQQQSYTSSHQAETASSFIKASIDGGYGSMNQEVDSSRESESGVEAVAEDMANNLRVTVPVEKTKQEVN